MLAIILLIVGVLLVAAMWFTGIGLIGFVPIILAIKMFAKGKKQS